MFSFPRPIKTSKCNKIYIILNFVMRALEFKDEETIHDISNLLVPDRGLILV